MNSRQNYQEYLKIDRILSSQDLESVRANRPAHDEMLFIVIHQTYELWFKEILFELDSVLTTFKQPVIPESNLGMAAHRMNRVVEILKLLNAQIKILETMTPLDFLDFRDLIDPASGFQSTQFRLLEVKLGLVVEQRVPFYNQPYHESLDASGRQKALAAEGEESLFVLIDRWLARTPFLENSSFSFPKVYLQALEAMLARDRNAIIGNASLSEVARDRELEKVEQVRHSALVMLDEKRYQELREAGTRRLSHRALLATLFINIYRDRPALHSPFRLLNSLMDIDELMAGWRFNHALMVHRIIGRKIGTGGSSGYDYLRSTIEKHKIFGELFDLSTLYIPRSSIPALPEEIAATLGFKFETQI